MLWEVTMKNILCFGDSNTYGLIPFGGRLDEHTRWTRVLSSLLGKDYWIHEEGLNGRTTCLDDPVWPGRNALDYLNLCLETHEPLDLTILMLGTNDLKACFAPSAEIIAGHIRMLADKIQQATHAPLLIISPVPLGEKMSTGPCAPDFPPTSVEVSHQLSASLKETADICGAWFLDAGKYAAVSDIDSVHITPEGHRSLARAVYEKLKAMNF